ncbi:capsule assembly Wzi family protein [Pseudoalteromonas sp. G4]|uniref:capsule assembly Wzi family protein n=1 Tax=Pseudoalteromonas sp. G4 TaxID=2992761 RepID=UPI00237DB27F|nr:capsule assembly Wzi family protein [Pseudoalteromonas sp. G4]MDE3272971.1 capsule assembly Wzi family protein [Pseudoalteromonas sp. G4]
MKLTHIAASCSLVFAANVFAEPWIGTDDPFLRAAIEQLVSEGAINRPVNSYPLMWQGIAQDLSQINRQTLSEDGLFALRKVQHALNVAKSGSYSSVRVSGNSEPSNLQSFGQRNKHKGNIQGTSVLMGDRVTAKVSIGYNKDATSQKELNYDGSYLAVLYGNWSVSVEQVNKWFGPSNDNTLLLSNNADPIPGLRLSRLNTDYYGPKFLSFIGAWNFSAFVGQDKYPKNDDKDNLFWAMRFSSMPINGLEIGINQTAQFDSPNADHGFGALSDVILTKNKLDDAGVNEYNQLTSIDAKYSTRLFNQSVALYGEYAGTNELSFLPEDAMFSIGAEHFFGTQDYLVKSYIEYSDTESNCTFINDVSHCQYQHQYYEQGYAHLGENIAASIGGNVKSLSLSTSYQTTNGYAGFVKLRTLDFVNKGEANLDTNVSERLQLEVGYQQGLFDGLLKLKATTWRDKFESNSETEFAMSGSWEYRF